MTFSDTVLARTRGADGFEPPPLTGYPSQYPSGMTEYIGSITLDELFVAYNYMINALAQQRYGNAHPDNKRKVLAEELDYLDSHGDSKNINHEIIVHILQRTRA